jgi:protein regulator of cytokinesis 1
MSHDLKKTLYDVQPSFVELERTQSMSISDSTLDRLAGKVHALNQEKKQRLRKVFVFVIRSSMALY